VKFYLTSTGNCSDNWHIIADYLSLRGWMCLGEHDPFALDDISESDLFLMFLPGPVDSYIKLGAALAAGIPALVLTQSRWLLTENNVLNIFRHHKIEYLIDTDCSVLAFQVFKNAKKIISKTKRIKNGKNSKHRL